MTQIIILLSNSPTHILEGIIKNNTNRLHKEEIVKQIKNQLLPYIIIKNMENIEIPTLKRPNKEEVDEIIEYQTLYSISISNMANKKINENIEETDKIIEEKIYNYTQDIEGNIILNKDIYKIINDIRFKIYEMDKEQWNYYEDLIEEVHKCLNLKNAEKKKEKKKVGRPPKRNKNPATNQTIIDSFIQKACKNEEKKAEDRKMDIEK